MFMTESIFHALVTSKYVFDWMRLNQEYSFNNLYKNTILHDEIWSKMVSSIHVSMAMLFTKLRIW